MKNFIVSNDVDCDGTSLQGYIEIDFKTLVEVLGKPPSAGDEYKIDAEWPIKFDDGTVATIYNWKDGINYNGTRGIPIEDIHNWHIGGKSRVAVDKVKELFVVKD